MKEQIKNYTRIIYHKLFNDNYKHADTLSEALITLVLIGIISTIAAGTMVADYKKNETVVNLKKFYTNFSHAFATLDKINPISLVNEESGENSSYSFFGNYLIKVLNVSKDCKTSTIDDCKFEFKELNGKDVVLNRNWSRFFLDDGTFVAFKINSYDDESVVYFYVDINGKKRLNVVGRDIFLFEYLVNEKKFLPYGYEYPRKELTGKENNNGCNSTKNGNYCAALIMKDNWQIIKGYPWAQARYVIQ